MKKRMCEFWEWYSESWRDEWEFWKRNPEFPLVLFTLLGLQIWCLFR